MPIIYYAGAVLLIIVLALVLKFSIKLLFQLIVNVVLGGLMLLIINWLGAPYGVNIPLTELNSLVVGFLGIPGALILLGIQLL